MIMLFAEIEAATRAKVTTINYDYSLLSNDERANGILVESVPEQPEQRLGKNFHHYVNPSTGEQWYEHVDRPKTEIEILKEENALLKARDVVIQEDLSFIFEVLGA